MIRKKRKNRKVERSLFTAVFMMRKGLLLELASLALWLGALFVVLKRKRVVKIKSKDT